MLMGKGSGTRVELVPCNKLKRRKCRIITSITNAKGGCLQYNISDALLLFFIKASASTYSSQLRLLRFLVLVTQKTRL